MPAVETTISKATHSPPHLYINGPIRTVVENGSGINAMARRAPDMIFVFFSLFLSAKKPHIIKHYSLLDPGIVILESTKEWRKNRGGERHFS